MHMIHNMVKPDRLNVHCSDTILNSRSSGLQYVKICKKNKTVWVNQEPKYLYLQKCVLKTFAWRHALLSHFTLYKTIS